MVSQAPAVDDVGVTEPARTARVHRLRHLVASRFHTLRGQHPLHRPESWLLLLAIGLAAPVSHPLPGPGLDPGWITGLNIARLHRLQFGSGIEFTYGPWGFLDYTQAVSRLNLLAGLLFAIVSVGCLWYAVQRVLRGRLGGVGAAVAATVLVVQCAPQVTASAMLFAAGVLAALRFVLRRRPGFEWIPAAVAATGALLMQVKLSEGIVLVLIAGATAAFAPGHRLRRLAEAVAGFVLATVVTWLLIGQSLTSYPAFLRNGLEIARGYSEAMSLESKPNLFSYLVIAAMVGVVAGYLVRLARAGTGRWAVLGAVVICFLVLYLGFREGTGRHGPGQLAYAYFYALPLLAAFVHWARGVAFRVGVLATVVLLTSTAWLPVSPGQATQRWATDLQLLVDSKYQTDQLRTASQSAQRHYKLSPQVQAALGSNPVTVDPFETTAVWAYRLNWRPVPVFQNYAAYTARLDQLNARALLAGPANQMVLRAPDSYMDHRNVLWDPPHYTLTEVCDYQVVQTDAHWMLLGKGGADRCSAAHQIAVQHAAAGQLVTVPRTPADALVTMTFVPDRPGPLARLGRLVSKSFHPLIVEADGLHYRLPRALAGGPLLVQLPASSGWPTVQGGGTSYRSLRFTDPGTVRFSVRTLSGS